MERMDRRIFMGKAGRWALGLAALGLTGTLASCSSGESATSTAVEEKAAESNVATGQQAPSPTALKAVVTDKCVGCGKCTRGVCPEGAISLAGKRAVISDACRGCGDCVGFCPAGAIVLAQASVGTVSFEGGGTDGPFASALQQASG